MPSQRALLVTVAGTSTRFRATAGRNVLKCLHHEARLEESLLYFYVWMARKLTFDVVRFVGGYQFKELEAALQSPVLRSAASGIDLGCVFNPAFETKGSGYSLHLGVQELLGHRSRHEFRELVFMEGDLAVDVGTLRNVIAEPGDVLTACSDPITAEKSVVVYRTIAGEVKFVYDVRHASLTIPEPFQAVYNSGQVWKFADLDHLRRVADRISPEQLAGTNLVLVQKYFEGRLNPVVLTFARWVNCNTLQDYKAARTLLQGEMSV